MFSSTARVAACQLAILVAIAAIAFIVRGEKTAMSVAYGAAVALLGSLLMHAREQESHSDWTVHKQLRQFYRLAAERYLLVGSLLAIGFLSDKVEPLALLLGFILTQAGWLAVLKK